MFFKEEGERERINGLILYIYFIEGRRERGGENK
jgi:hypothetical protein